MSQARQFALRKYAESDHLLQISKQELARLRYYKSDLPRIKEELLANFPEMSSFIKTEYAEGDPFPEP